MEDPGEFGDLMIKTVSEILKKCVEEAKLYRIGGDEFVAIAENSSKRFFEKPFDLINQELAADSSHSKNSSCVFVHSTSTTEFFRMMNSVRPYSTPLSAQS